MVTCLVIGDMGKGTKDQYNVGKLMKELYKKYNIRFVLGLGDNIYPDGCTSVKDKLFKSNFEKPYAILPNQRWYMCLGNHDYGYLLNKEGLLDNSSSSKLYQTFKEMVYASKCYSFVKVQLVLFT